MRSSVVILRTIWGSLSILACLLAQGCFTPWVWDNPSTDCMRKSQISGVASVMDDQQHRQAYLVVTYSARLSVIPYRVLKSRYAIPLYDGWAPVPLSYRGPLGTPAEIEMRLEREALARPSRYRFSKESRKLGMTMSWTPVCTDPGVVQEECFHFVKNRDGEGGCRLFAYRWDGARLTLVDASDASATLDGDCRVVLLPDSQKRFFSERVGPMAIATIATPITLVMDAVIETLLICEPVIMAVPRAGCFIYSACESAFADELQEANDDPAAAAASREEST